MAESSKELWNHNGGDLRANVERISKAQRPGVVLGIELEHRSLKKARDAGLSREREGQLLQKAWQTTIATLPSDAIGRRSGWSRFEFVLEGTQSTLVALGSRLLATVRRDNDLSAFDWHLVFTEVFLGEPERTFACDPGYDLRTAEGKSVIVWVQPYPGADWRESQRYPTVTFVPSDQSQTSAR